MKNIFLIVLLFVSNIVNAQEYSFICTLHKGDGTIVNNCNGRIYMDHINGQPWNKVLLIDIENPYNKKQDYFYEIIQSGDNIALCDEADIIADTEVPMIKKAINCFTHDDDDRSLEIYVARAKSGGKFQYIGLNYNSKYKGNFNNTWVSIPYSLDNFLGIYRILDVAKESIRLNKVEY